MRIEVRVGFFRKMAGALASAFLWSLLSGGCARMQLAKEAALWRAQGDQTWGIIQSALASIPRRC